MKALEFTVSLAPNGQIDVPLQIALQIPEGKQIQVLLLWETSNGEDDWNTLALQSLEAAYSPADSIYEQLAHESPIR